MSRPQGREFDRVLAQAVAQGLLPADAPALEDDDRPWPVLVLIGIGAWLAALPLLIGVATLIGDVALRGNGPYLAGVLMLAGGLAMLRLSRGSIFVEQLALPVWMAAIGLLCFAVTRDLDNKALAFGCMSALSWVLALASPSAGLRGLLGAAAASFAAGMFWNGTLDRQFIKPFWMAGHALLGVWLLALWVQRSALQSGTRARWAAALESVAGSWLLVALASLALWSGMTFLVGGLAGNGLMRALVEAANELGRGAGFSRGMQVFSALLAVAAAVAGASGLRRPVGRTAGLALVVTTVVVTALAWLLPSLGAALLAWVICLKTRRPLLAAMAVVTSVWIIGSFYYQLAWPLTTKALLLTAAGALLGTVAWGLHRVTNVDVQPAPGGSRHALASAKGNAPTLAILFSTVLALALAAAAIWQKEDVIAHGQKIFVPLAPVDPRSLTQGDYMRLNFQVPALDKERATGTPAGRPQVVARKDERGVASLLRRDRGEPLAAGEFRIELTQKHGQWSLVTDAWFFEEGQAQRFAQARYGEFRVTGDGRALLVGLADNQLKSIPP